MIIGGLSVYLRAVPERLWHWVAGQTTLIITVSEDDAVVVGSGNGLKRRRS